jgi:hypothetical protein
MGYSSMQIGCGTRASFIDWIAAPEPIEPEGSV